MNLGKHPEIRLSTIEVAYWLVGSSDCEYRISCAQEISQAHPQLHFRSRIVSKLPAVPEIFHFWWSSSGGAILEGLLQLSPTFWRQEAYVFLILHFLGLKGSHNHQISNIHLLISLIFWRAFQLRIHRTFWRMAVISWFWLWIPSFSATFSNFSNFWRYFGYFWRTSLATWTFPYIEDCHSVLFRTLKCSGNSFRGKLSFTDRNVSAMEHHISERFLARKSHGGKLLTSTFFFSNAEAFSQPLMRGVRCVQCKTAI